MGERRGVYRVLVAKPKVKNHLGDPGIDGRIILRLIIRKWVCVDGIELAWDRDRWWAPVNAVMNLLCSIKCGEFLELLKTG